MEIESFQNTFIYNTHKCIQNNLITFLTDYQYYINSKAYDKIVINIKHFCTYLNNQRFYIILKLFYILNVYSKYCPVLHPNYLQDRQQRPVIFSNN